MLSRHLLDRRVRKPRGVVALVALAAVTTLAGCGPTIFQDDSTLVVIGNPPAPPPPPEPEPEPPKAAAPVRVLLTAKAIEISDVIQFEYNKAEIKPESFGLLDEIADVILKNPQIKELSIEGHTDGDGSPKSNRKLSDNRAKSVKKYLVDKGVAEAMLLTKGWGEDKPVADNDSDEGKAKNRRVEFLITKQDEIKKAVEVDPATGEQKPAAEAAPAEGGN
jgi:OOP family OmpA-OmpF porin